MKNSIEGCTSTIARTVALDYLNRGFSVIPLQNKQGVPGIGWGWAETTYATKDQINQWFTTEKYQVGIVCGKISSVVVVDVDSPEALEACITRGFPDTPKVETSRGHHYYFKWPGEYVKTLAPLTKNLPKDQQIPDLDIRGDGGCIVAPPSIHEGGHQYVWCDGYSLDDLPLAELPKWILEIANGRTTVPADQKSGMIKDGGRNCQMASIAGSLRYQGLGGQALGTALQEINLGRCIPPLPEQVVTTIARSIEKYPAGPATKDKRTQTQILMEYGKTMEFFANYEKRAYVKIKKDDHSEIMEVKSPEFTHELCSRFKKERGSLPNSQAVHDVIEDYASEALRNTRDVFLRVAGSEGHIYVDLANDQWEVLDITAGGWKITKDCPVMMERTGAMKSLPRPERGGSLERLREFVNVDNNNWILLVSWLINCFNPKGPYPILLIQGVQGSAKTTTARILSQIIDPSVCSPRTTPEGMHDLFIAAKNQWMLSYDNLSGTPKWFSDVLCQLSTGGGMSTRQLYTDNREEYIDAKRPVVLNGIDAMIDRNDLLDRTISVELLGIAEGKRITEASLWEGFNKVRPQILGAICDVLVGQMQQKGKVQMKEKPRMADFAEFIVECEPSLPWGSGKFMEKYKKNRRENILDVLSTDLVGIVLQRFLNDHDWGGYLLELCSSMEEKATDGEKKQKEWPKNPKSLGAHLKRIIPALAAIGIELQFGEKTNKGRKLSISFETPVDPIIWLEDNTGEGTEAIDNDTWVLSYDGVLSLREPVLGGEENDLVPFN